MASQLALLPAIPKTEEATGIVHDATALFERLEGLEESDRIKAINEIREALHRYSPFAGEPVDCVRWVPIEEVRANDYNPNAVAPPEMQLLGVSIAEDGYTQPIVVWRAGEGYEVVDGFHRNRVAREVDAVRRRIRGYLPVVVMNNDREDRGDRMAATVRHNRARGKHRVEGMSDIVIELKRRNWSDERIASQLGMDQDEILRLCQITGLVDVFADQEFSRSWDVIGDITEADLAELSEGADGEAMPRTVNTSDPNRVFHTYEKWECYRAGFYDTTKEGVTREAGEAAYREFLADQDRFADALGHVVGEWKHSCEHYLTNTAMNRIAWLGQAAACYALRLPAIFRGGYHLLTPEQQEQADQLALFYLNQWLVDNKREAVSLEAAYSYDRQMEIY